MNLVKTLQDARDDKSELGNKGANLVVMIGLGLPVPPGFVVTIEAYREWRRSGTLPLVDLETALAGLELNTGSRLGEGLEVSVRSTAPVSMPGMMDTILNVGSRDLVYDAIRHVFESWDNPRAIEYRRLGNISPTIGTAVIVQAMVYGNRDERSGTGVAFSRNPSTGEKELFGEYLPQAQGEELVSGVQTPEPLSTLQSQLPEVYGQLAKVAADLEQHFRDVQDIEFTVESGRLFILQTRSAKRSGLAAIKVLVDMANEGLILSEEAVMRATATDIEGLLHKQLATPDANPVARGLNAAPGAVSGHVVFDVKAALEWSRKGVNVILVRPETTPDDIEGIAAADGVLTQKGGLTSHAAIVTRAMGKPCISGAEGIEIDLSARQFSVDDLVVKEGDEITIDGTSGTVYLGRLPVEDASLPPEMDELMSWADGFRRLGVLANADTPEMITEAKGFGAEGIGLCRTERMFTGQERLSAIRAFILAATDEERGRAVVHLAELQRSDFRELFEALEGLPIIIRLLDLPLHEFLPPIEETTDPTVRQRIAELEETNPMLGHRGVRLAVTTPEIYRMQIEAVQAAVAEVPADVSIMVPQVVTVREVTMVKELSNEPGMRLGIMLETARACLRAGEIAPEVDFFSFGTNDLTQAVYSFSREDVEKKFLPTYLEKGILEDNPFEVLDIQGVGRLMEIAISDARQAKKGISIGVCGEQAGDPGSIRFLHKSGVDYVSVSPFRVFKARLAAAQAAIESRVSPRGESSPGSLDA